MKPQNVTGSHWQMEPSFPSQSSISSVPVGFWRHFEWANSKTTPPKKSTFFLISKFVVIRASEPCAFVLNSRVPAVIHLKCCSSVLWKGSWFTSLTALDTAWRAIQGMKMTMKTRTQTPLMQQRKKNPPFRHMTTTKETSVYLSYSVRRRASANACWSRVHSLNMHIPRWVTWTG